MNKLQIPGNSNIQEKHKEHHDLQIAMISCTNDLLSEEGKQSIDNQRDEYVSTTEENKKLSLQENRNDPWYQQL